MQELMESINWAIIAPFIMIQFILLIVAIIDLVKADETRGSKWMWVFIIVFINIVGPVLYFIFGRRRD
ncbi:PLD nuclease N-terminal domain-containing protein [Oceanobacillus saliphilus]|uniref:PLD nuclease N-terminal domain-containing protein n=1 Tax=Oceanobacillus saliphilus TaxID=2925834 RepID=UPI00201DCC85|nr:PLD nuclease N-terminal domain-containing protein [Oceanobacillus saliphilus]